jgi:vancomycin resistance protein VanW
MINLKKYIPAPVKLFLKLKARVADDFFSGHHKLFCSAANIQQQLSAPLKKVVYIEQIIKPADSSSNKVFNLSLAINKINNIKIGSGQIFSFWKLVGEPSEKNGYKKSRSIINGELKNVAGGGLCQLSGLIYFLSLQTGLTIMERHSHSIDIYKEEERFTPLGSDATVAYGYKDCRIKNNFTFPVCFSFTITGNLLTGIVLAAENMKQHAITFEYLKSAAFIQVKTISTNNGSAAIIANNRYGILK